MARNIHSTAVVGNPLRWLQGCVPPDSVEPATITLPESIYVGPFATIGEGVILGEGVVLDAYCSVEPYASIGTNSILIYRAWVGGDAKIGRDCVIGGFVPENAVIGDRCRVFGNLVHTHRDTTMSWDHHETPEPSVTVLEDSFVGFGATVAGGFSVGPRAYVCAGSIVTRPVPPDHIACGVNEICHFTAWHGQLRENPIFRR